MGSRHRTPFELLADDASWTIEGNAVASKMEEWEWDNEEGGPEEMTRRSCL
jgi:hypothetical protein